MSTGSVILSALRCTGHLFADDQSVRAVTKGEETCPKWLDEHKPPNADKYLGYKKTAQLKRRQGAQSRWKRAQTKKVIGTVLTEQLAVERTQQVQEMFEFLVKDYQPRYYYFECIFLME